MTKESVLSLCAACSTKIPLPPNSTLQNGTVMQTCAPALERVPMQNHKTLFASLMGGFGFLCVCLPVCVCVCASLCVCVPPCWEALVSSVCCVCASLCVCVSLMGGFGFKRCVRPITKQLAVMYCEVLCVGVLCCVLCCVVVWCGVMCCVVFYCVAGDAKPHLQRCSSVCSPAEEDRWHVFSCKYANT